MTIKGRTPTVTRTWSECTLKSTLESQKSGKALIEAVSRVVAISLTSIEAHGIKASYCVMKVDLVTRQDHLMQ